MKSSKPFVLCGSVTKTESALVATPIGSPADFTKSTPRIFSMRGTFIRNSASLPFAAYWTASSPQTCGCISFPRAMKARLTTLRLGMTHPFRCPHGIQSSMLSSLGCRGTPAWLCLLQTPLPAIVHKFLASELRPLNLCV